jgi:uncharacterized membrane protein YgcG
MFSTLFGLALITLIMVGIRLVVMQTVQQRRERENRQINERLRTLIAAYKALGGSFTGDLAVDPSHLRDLRRRADIEAVHADEAMEAAPHNDEPHSSDRARRIRDAVEAALSDIILLGTEEQVQLAAKAATELTAGRPARTDQLVISLRDFIRQVLDLEPVPTHLSIPAQGPARLSASRGAGKGEGGGNQGGGKGMGGGAGGGGGMGMGGNLSADEDSSHHR